MKWEERVLSYEAAGWPKGSLVYDGTRWLHGLWIIGNDYRPKPVGSDSPIAKMVGSNGITIYGQYPPRYLNRLMSLFPDVHSNDEILHLFSGTLAGTDTPGYKLDYTPWNCWPGEFEKVGAAEDVAKIFEGHHFELVVADPPYSKADGKKYGVPYPNKHKVLRELSKIVIPGGHAAWLDSSTPIWAKRDWNLMGLITVWCGSNRLSRTLSIFERPTDQSLTIP